MFNRLWHWIRKPFAALKEWSAQAGHKVTGTFIRVREMTDDEIEAKAKDLFMSRRRLKDNLKSLYSSFLLMQKTLPRGQKEMHRQNIRIRAERLYRFGVMPPKTLAEAERSIIPFSED